MVRLIFGISYYQQGSMLGKAFVNNLSPNIKLSKTQLTKRWNTLHEALFKRRNGWHHENSYVPSGNWFIDQRYKWNN